MKKLIASLIILASVLFISTGSKAQPPMPPSDPNSSGDQPPAYPAPGAPVEPGTGILLILAAAYGLNMIREVMKEGTSL